MSRVKLDKQVGGNHYEKMPIQPIEYILANKLGFVEGSVVKYVSRWPDKGGVEDLKKARQLLDMKISELEAEADDVSSNNVERHSLSELVDFFNTSLPDDHKASITLINSDIRVAIQNTDVSIKNGEIAYHCYDKGIEERISFSPRLILEWILGKIEADDDSEVILEPKDVMDLRTRDCLYDLIYEDDDIIPDVYKITNTNRISIPSQDITIGCEAGEIYDLYPTYYCKKRNNRVLNFVTADQALEWVKENLDDQV